MLSYVEDREVWKLPQMKMENASIFLKSVYLMHLHLYPVPLSVCMSLPLSFK